MSTEQSAVTALRPRRVVLPQILEQMLLDAPVGFAVYDVDGRYLRANQHLAIIDGVGSEERIGHRPSEVLGPVGVEIEKRVARVLATGKEFAEDNFEVSGDRTYWQTHWYPLSDETGRPYAVLVVAVDRSARQIAERELQRSEQRYRTLVEASTTDVWRTDGAGALLDDMPGWRSATGQTPDELLGWGWLEGIHPADRPRVERAWQVARAEQSTYEQEFRIGAAGGPWRTMLARGLPILSRGGRVREWVGTTVDVTVERAAEDAKQQAFRQVQTAALTLQASLLPQQIWQPEEVDVCAHYVAGVEGTEVGGDWYDVIELGAGRVALVIGDVMGRGIRAAAVMGQLRTAVRAYARLDLAPSDLMEQLDALVAELDEAQIVTCVYAVYDPGLGTLELVNAGHVPPLLAGTGSTAVRVSGPVGPPLGTGSGVYDECRALIEPGSRLVLYTDGLVESRDEDIDRGIDRLAAAVCDTWPSLDQCCAGVLERLGRADSNGDDVALLVAAFPRVGELRTDSVNLAVPGGLESVGPARRVSASRLSEWRLDEDTIDSALLVLNEMVTNALTHGSGDVELVLRRTPHRLYVEVRDASMVLPHRRLADRDDENGRGLQMVAMLAERWGVRPTAIGKSVWAQLALPEPAVA